VASGAAKIAGGRRRRDGRKTDPQFPEERWWLADGQFVGFRIVCEP